MAIYKSNVERENKAFADSSNMYATKPGFAHGAEQEPPSGRLSTKEPKMENTSKRLSKSSSRMK